MIPVEQVPDSQTAPSEMLARDGQLIPVNGLSRREVVALLSSIAAGLAGCSSGPPTSSVTPPPPPPNPPPAGLSQVAVTVVPPSGSTLAVNTLSLKVMGQSIALTTAGTLTAGVSPSAPTMALLTDANGNGIMAGFLDAALGGAQAISPRSTGVVLTWFALGGPFLPATVKSQILALLSADPTMDTLGGVIAQRIAAVPLAIVNADVQVGAALNAVLATLTAAPAGSIGGGAHLASGTPSTITVKSEPNDGSGSSTQTTQGGVNVQPDGTIAGIDISNAFRRPVRAYVYETQTLTAGVVTDISPATLFAGPFDLGEPATLAPTSGIHPFLSQSAPFHSFTINPIALVLDGASDQTTYEVVVIGPSSSGMIPPFFGAARYTNEVAGWTAAISDLFAQSYYTDLVHALLLEMTGFASILPTSPNLVAAGVNTQKFAGLPIQTTTIGGIRLPSSPQALAAALTELINDLPTTISLANQYLGIAPTIADPTVAAVLAKVNSIDWQASLQSGANFLLKLGSPFSNLSNYQANGALGKLLANLANTDFGLLWEVEAGKAQVTITPPNPSVAPGGFVALTVVLSSDLTGIYEFDWSSSDINATFSAADQTNALVAITTRDFTVNLNASPSDVSPIVVTVAVYEVVAGTRGFVTRVTTTVTLLQKSTLSPASATLAVGDRQTFIVSVSGTLPPTGVKYVWSVAGGSGSIGATNPVATTAPQITYTAQQKGTDTLSVQVFDANNQLLSNTSAVIRVDPDPFVQFAITGTWNPATTPANGSYVFTDFQGGRSASVFGTGLDELVLGYDFAADNTVGVALGLFVPTGQAFSAGETFSKIVTGQPATAGTFQVTLSQDLSDVENSTQRTPAGTGSCTIDTLSTLVDGTFVAQYSFTIDNGAGGLITGSGVGQWT